MHAHIDWRIEIVEYDKLDPSLITTVKAIRSKFRLVQVETNCALISKGVKLPEWGSLQQEAGSEYGKGSRIMHTYPLTWDESSKSCMRQRKVEEHSLVYRRL